MKIVLTGYGRMGKMIEWIAIERWHTIVATVDPYSWSKKSITELSWWDFDVVIDFSTPNSVLDNIKYYAENNFKAVIGTTWWYNHIESVKNMYSSSEWAILWASNFSIWVNLFWQILKQSAKIMDNVDAYDVFWHEFHHNQKVDSPSWTAISTGNVILENMKRKTKIVTERLDRKIEPDELHISSTRWGSIPGTHSIFFDSPADTIEIKHTARGREWFALGAVLWAEWLQNKKWYNEVETWMNEMMN